MIEERGDNLTKEKNKDLSENELVIMKTVWDSPESLTIQEMVDIINEKGGVITTAAAIPRVKGLQKKNFLQVDGQKLVTTVYARTYRALITKEEYVQLELGNLGQLLSDGKTSGALGLVEMLLKGRGKHGWNKQDIQSLEQMVQKSKEELKEDSK